MSVNQQITTAPRRCQANSFMPGVGGRSLRSAPAALLLSAELQVVGQTPERLEYLRQLVPPATGGRPVAAGAYNVAAQLLAVEVGVDPQPPSARVQPAAIRSLMAKDRTPGQA